MKDSIILVVDDDPAICFAFQKTFETRNIRTISAMNGAEALAMVSKSKPDVIFMDVSMPIMNGLEALEALKESNPEIPVIIITGEGNMQTAIRAMQLGAYDYLTKPLDIDIVRLTGQRAFELVNMRNKINELEKKVETRIADGSTQIIGKTTKIQEVFKKIGVISTTPQTTNILILGETGTGKELVARAIHESGSSKEEPFQAINCTVLPENLLESELFGHEKGAFTGADKRKEGKFEIAGEGTLFLDEIGDMPDNLQKKLLRVLQERSFERLGGNEPIPLKARVVAATHHNLKEAINQKQFREDLFYRLNVIEIALPTLRERKDDIPLLVTHFLDKYNERLSKKVSHVDPEALEILTSFAYPGNVRELENMIERAVALERGSILTSRSFPSLSSTIEDADIDIPLLSDDFNLAKQTVVQAFEQKFISVLLTKAGGNVTEAARKSGIERQSFQRLMKKYNLHSKDFRRE